MQIGTKIARLSMYGDSFVTIVGESKKMWKLSNDAKVWKDEYKPGERLREYGKVSEWGSPSYYLPDDKIIKRIKHALVLSEISTCINTLRRGITKDTDPLVAGRILKRIKGAIECLPEK